MSSSPSLEASARVPKFLTLEQIDFFHRNGYLVLESFLTSETVQSLRDEMASLLHGCDYSSLKSVFTTNEQARSSDDYFLSSGDKICYFWEAGAFDSEGKLVQEPSQCINKIGHALHDLNPAFQAVSYDPRLGALARDLGLEIPLAVQSMYICKQPRIGGEVGAHQDGTFLYTEPQSVLGFWWALEDCTTTNGCLWAVPGSHTLPVSRRFHRTNQPSEGEPKTVFTPADNAAWDLSGAVPLPMGPGALVLLHYALVHYSEANRSPLSRHAYSIHVVDGRTHYPEDNWLQRPPSMPYNALPDIKP